MECAMNISENIQKGGHITSERALRTFSVSNNTFQGIQAHNLTITKVMVLHSTLFLGFGEICSKMLINEHFSLISNSKLWILNYKTFRFCNGVYWIYTPSVMYKFGFFKWNPL